MELIEFQESAVWRTKFFDMNQKLQKIESKSLSTEVIAENMILTEWNSLPSSFEYRRDGVVVRASASQSVDLGFISLVESYQKTLKTGIHSFPAWRSAHKG